MGIKKIKISEMPLAPTTKGLLTIATDLNNKSVAVNLGDLASESYVRDEDSKTLDKAATSISTHNSSVDSHKDMRASLAGNSSRLTAAETNISNISSGKADKVTPATAGNLAKLGVDGNIVDSGVTMEQMKKALFIDMWNQAAGANGSYNQADDKFYLYGESTNYVNALLAYRVSSLIQPENGTNFSSKLYNYKGELLFNNFVFAGGTSSSEYNFYSTFRIAVNLKVIDITNDLWSAATIINDLRQTFSFCRFLKKIVGILDISPITKDALVSISFWECSSLVDVKLSNLKVNMVFKHSSSLSQQSILYMIQNSAATSAITITLHPTAYAMATANAAIQTALREKPLVSLAAEQ